MTADIINPTRAEVRKAALICRLARCVPDTDSRIHVLRLDSFKRLTEGLDREVEPSNFRVGSFRIFAMDGPVEWFCLLTADQVENVVRKWSDG